MVKRLLLLFGLGTFVKDGDVLVGFASPLSQRLRRPVNVSAHPGLERRRGNGLPCRWHHGWTSETARVICLILPGMHSDTLLSGLLRGNLSLACMGCSFSQVSKVLRGLSIAVVCIRLVWSHADVLLG